MSDQNQRRGSTSVDPGPAFTVRVRRDGARHVVDMEGDLDLASRAAATEACSSPAHRDVTVDLSRVAFMDSAGYGALVDATEQLERRGGSLVMLNPVGEPLRLLELIEEIDVGLCAPLRLDSSAPPTSWGAS